MPRVPLLALVALAAAAPCAAQVGGGPHAPSRPAPRLAPQDRPFSGAIALDVDATDIDHKVLRVRERVPAAPGAPLTLLYPQWETASHAPTAEANALAGLRITAGGRPVAWRRDPLDVYAFHVETPPGATALDLEFQVVTPTSPGRLAMEPEAVTVQWQASVLYPAGWYVRDIPVDATLRLPAGFTAATSLPRAGAGPPDVARFGRVSLETLVDSPVFAGRHTRRLDLGSLDGAPVGLDLVADAPASLEIAPGYADKLRAAVAQAGLVFGPPHFARYAFLTSLSDALPSGGGTEHQRSSENGFAPDFLQHPQRYLVYQDLLAHEFVHSWNGKFRTPQGLWTADFNTPSDDSLLWVYEGQTEYWGIVLAARAGLRTRQETLDLLAVKAAEAQLRVGRVWKSLADSALDPVFDAGHGVTWRDWQGREAYYVEGVLLWLDVDTLIRERTGGRRSLDDFARAFFGAGGRSEAPRTYTFDDLCAALNAVTPMDWRGFLTARLDAHDDAHLFDGLRRGGYAFVWGPVETETARQAAEDAGGLDLRASLGVLVGEGGRLRSVAWEGPAFRAGLSVGARLTTVDGAPYSDAALLAAMRAPGDALRLGFTQDGRDRTATIAGAGPPRYPGLRAMGGARWLDAILSPRPAR